MTIGGGETVGTAFVAIRPKTTGFSEELTTGLGGALKGFAGTLGAVFATAGVAKFFTGAISEAQEAQKVAAQTAAVLKSTGEAANVTADEVANLSQKLSEKTGIDDEVIASGENMLLTFTNIRNEVGKGNDIFDQATTAALDMSVALGEDLQSASIQLGKALQDPVAGVTALQRVGVRLTEQQKDQVKALVATGDTMGAQKVILAELTKEFGGSAEAQATALDKAGVAFKNFQEAVGTAIGPLLGKVAEAFTGLIVGATDLVGAMGGFVNIAPIIAGAIALIGIAFDAAFTPLAVFTAAVTAAVFAASQLGLIDAPVKELGDTAETTARQLEKLSPEQALAQFKKWSETADDVSKHFVEGPNRALEQFIRIAQASPGAAKLIIDGMKAGGEDTTTFERALAKLALTYHDNAAGAAAAAQANEDFRKSISDIQDDVIKAAGGVLGYQQAVLDVAKAQADLDKVRADSTSTTADLQEAEIRLAQAQLGVAQAQHDTEQSTSDLLTTFSTVPGSLDAQIAKYEELKRTNPEVAASYDPILTRLYDIRQFFADQAQLKLDIDVRAALDHLAEVQNKLNETAAIAAGYGGLPVPLIDAEGHWIGPPLNFQHGGIVPGYGPPDSVPAMLTPGETVLPPGVSGAVHNYYIDAAPKDALALAMELALRQRVATLVS